MRALKRGAVERGQHLRIASAMARKQSSSRTVRRENEIDSKVVVARRVGGCAWVKGCVHEIAGEPLAVAAAAAVGPQLHFFVCA